MTLTAVFHPVARNVVHKDEHRWAVSVAVTVGLHIAAVVILLVHHQAVEPDHPPPALPSVTMIDLQPLPVPPPPVLAVVPPPPEPQPQIQPQPKPVMKPVTPPKPVVHRVTPPAPSPVVEQVQESTPQTAAPAPAPMSAPAAPSTPVIDHAVPRFTDLIAAQLERYKHYPDSAKKRGDQGVALLRFTLDRDGNASNARIERSAGHAELDDEAIALLRRAAPLPQIPADIAANTLDIVVPVSFALH